MNELQNFNFKGAEVRTMLINDEPYFVGKDVASILGYSNTSKAILKHVDDEDKRILKSQNGTLEKVPNRGLQVINESGLYSLILSSKLPTAKEFKRWVTSEVLPAIRKHGAYLTDRKAADIVTNKDALADLLRQASEQLKAKDLQIAEMKPKALFADAVAASQQTVLIGELAKFLKQNGCDMGQNRLFTWMRKNGYLINRRGSSYNMPTQRAMNMGLFRIKETPIVHHGYTTVNKTPKVTGKGQLYFTNKFLGKEMYVQTVETEY